MITIIIADDHAIFTEGLSTMLSAANDIAVLGKATEGNGAMKLITRIRPLFCTLESQLA